VSGVAVGDRLPQLAVEVTARTVIMGASASRDWQPQHHDRTWAVERAGTRDIFLNTPNQAGWIERYLTAWAGPRARLGKLRFRMRRPVCPGDQLVFAGAVTGVTEDTCCWVDVAVELTVDEEAVTLCAARLAVPRDDADNPWAQDADAWTPAAAGALTLPRRGA
jgi:acyl dehydratase